MGQHHSAKQRRTGGKFVKADGSFQKVARTDEGRLPSDIPVPSLGNPETTLAVGGTAIYGGHLVENEKNSELTGTRKYQTYSNAIANVAIIAAGVRLLLNLAGASKWRVRPASDEDEAVEMADRVEGVLHGMKTPWHRIVRRLAGHRFYGFALAEWVARREEDGSIGFANMVSLPQITIERWMLEKDGSVLAAVQTSPQTAKETAIPIEKLVHVVDDSINDSPEGLGLLRHLQDSVKRLQRLQELEIFGFAGDLRGIPVGRAPLAELERMVKAKTISRAKADEMLLGLDSFIQRHVRSPDLGIMLDSTPYKATGENRTPSVTPQWGLELLDGGSYSLEAVAAAIVRIQREIARVLGVEHLLLGENSAGSRSLSSDKTQSFGLLVDATLQSIAEAVERGMLVPLFELNGWDKKLMPSLAPEAQAFRDPAEMAVVMRDLAIAGVQLDRQDEMVGEILDQLGLSRLMPLAKLDTDLLLSAQEAQDMAMETMEATARAKQADQDPDDGKGGDGEDRQRKKEKPEDDE